MGTGPLRFYAKFAKKHLKSRSGGTKIEVWAALVASWDVLGASWAAVWVHIAFGLGILGRLGGLLGRLGPKKVANMVPSWLPKRSQNR